MPHQGSDDGKSRAGQFFQIVLALIAASATILVGYWQYHKIDDTQNKAEEARKSFTGRVTDAESGKAIRGAKISLNANGVPPVLYTDSEGIFHFPLRNIKQEVHVIIDASGYSQYDRRVDPEATFEIEDIRLSPLKPAPSTPVEIKPPPIVEKPRQNEEEEELARLPFKVNNDAEPFAMKGRFEGEIKLTPKNIVIKVKTASLHFSESLPNGGDRYIEYIRSGLACNADGSWSEVSKSNKLPVDKLFAIGQTEDFRNFVLIIPRANLASVSGCWVVFEIAIRIGSDDRDGPGFSYVHTRRDLF